HDPATRPQEVPERLVGGDHPRCQEEQRERDDARRHGSLVGRPAVRRRPPGPSYTQLDRSVTVSLGTRAPTRGPGWRTPHDTRSSLVAAAPGVPGSGTRPPRDRCPRGGAGSGAAEAAGRDAELRRQGDPHAAPDRGPVLQAPLTATDVPAPARQ